MDEIKDFGTWQSPKGWEDITLKQYQEIEKVYDSDKEIDLIDLLHILYNKTADEIKTLPVEFTERLMSELSFLYKKPDFGKPSPSIVINDEEYKVNIMEKLKTGEYVAVNEILKADSKNYAAILAILCRKQGEIYNSDFEANIFDNRVKLFEQQPITKIMPIVSFFLQLWLTSEMLSQTYSQVEEILNRTANSIKTSQNVGALKRWYLTWQTKKLQKSLKSIKST